MYLIFREIRNHLQELTKNKIEIEYAFRVNVGDNYIQGRFVPIRRT